MGFTEVLTIIFIVLKLLGVIDWNWFLVLLPEIIAFVFYIVSIILVGVSERKLNKKMEDFWKDKK